MLIACEFAIRDLRQLLNNLLADVLLVHITVIVYEDLEEHHRVLADLVEALKHRFDGLPIHELCYYHSNKSTNETVQRFKHEAVIDEKVDEFGMTPFHLLALSQTPSILLGYRRRTI